MSAKTEKIPMYMKYSKGATQRWLDPGVQLKPSDLTKPSLDVDPEDYPLITSFNNMLDNTVQMHATVDIDQPLFEPAPRIVLFEEYEAFSVVRKKLYFRNKDSVGRRIKLMKPDTPFFEVSAPVTLSGEPLKQSKIASGMEVYFTVTFKPQEIREYAWDLVCSTERENFIVPLRAVGLRPLLNFPDEIDFGPCPIKSATEKKIVLQNLGTAVGKFSLSSNISEIVCPEQDISIEAGASYQLSLSFVPTSNQQISGEICVQFQNGIKCFIACKGCGKNVEVSLSTPSVTVESSYISLFSQKTLKIRNSSDAPIRYRWKSFATEGEEEAERERLLGEIDHIEEEERAQWQERLLSGAYENSDGRDIEEDVELDDVIDNGGNTNLPFAARVDEAMITRKYRNLRKALEMDKMLFVDDIFEISPIEGEVWAYSDMEITVCFRPDTAAQFNCLAFLDVSGKHERLSLQLMGQGIGPHAALSFEVLDVGDIFVNDVNHYELSIKNKGDIPAQWTFMSSLTRFGNKFQFSPTNGYLLPNQSQTMSIRFESDILGEFSEYFRFALQGNEDMLVCQIKGQVIGPTFHFDANSIDFGTVSFDYLHATNVRLVNTSKVPMSYNLHIPQDGTYLKKEFNIEPSRGTLAPKESVEVLVEFIPTSVKVYDYSLAVDVLGVGDMLLSIPVTAECVISAIQIDVPNRELDFGDIFIRYPYELELKLMNLSSIVHTKFEIAEQPKHTRSVCSYECTPSVAVIEPSDSMTVKVRLIGQKLGAFKVPVTIQVAGSQEPPMQAVLSFHTVGPKIVVMGNTELKWGNIDCLKDSTRPLTLMNTGLINANLKLFLKMARSCYRLDVRELVLEAQQSYEVQVIANLDDSVVTKDEVHIMVEEGDNLMVPLVAKGIGTTMYCKAPLDVLDLGTQLTNVRFEKQIVLENKGRRPQQLCWTNQTLKLENAARLVKAKKLGKDITQPNRLPKNLMPMEPFFTVTPMEITLRSRTATTFTFRGYSTSPKALSEIFVLESKVGKDRNMKEILHTKVLCEVVNPLLTFSSDELSFTYIWEKGVDAVMQQKEVVLTNSSAIPLSFVLKAEVPFNLNCYDQTLQPGESCEVLVQFDPTYRDDKQSHAVDQILQIQYRGHPQKDSIRLLADLVFPNLSFDASSIGFGCVLNDTSKTIRLQLTNTSKINVKYDWIFMEQGANQGHGTAHHGKDKHHKNQRQAVFNTPPSNIFDILPVTSILTPGQQEFVEFTMLSTNNMKMQGTVVCVVEGGPEYKFNILGESSNVAYELSQSVMDFGKVLITEKADQELIIKNTGRVPFHFNLFPTTQQDASYLEFFPSEGKVSANHEQKIVVRFRPGLPGAVKCTFTAQVAHFDAVTIDCFGNGIFPVAFIALPRYKKVGPYGEQDPQSSLEELWESFTNQAINNLLHPDVSLMPPAVPPPAAMGTTTVAPSYQAPVVLPPLPPPSFSNGDGDNDEDFLLMMMSTTQGFPVDQQSDVQSSTSMPPAPSSIASTTRGINPTTLDVEMQRLAVNQYVESKLQSLSQQQILDDETSPLLQELIGKYVPFKEVVAGRYVCDFGHVIMGQTKKKIFKVTNCSVLGTVLNWFFDKKHLGASGFSIEPEKVMKLGEGSAVDFAVKYFARTNQKPGPKSVILPLEMAGAPSLHIVLTANVCLPEIELSSQEVDVGKVVIGRSKKIYVRLKNVSPVSASWMMKKSGKDEARFTCEPSMGTLLPGKKVMVGIEFIPTEAKKSHVEFLLKVDQNRKHKAIKVVAEGLATPLVFNPTEVVLKPVIPFSEGGEQVITVSNPTEFPIEFFSVDFDTVYKEDEAMLTGVDLYDSVGLFRSGIRQPGDKLPKVVQEAFAAAQEAMAAAAVPTASTATAAAAEEIIPLPEGGDQVAETTGDKPQDGTTLEVKTAHNFEKPIIRAREGYRDRNLHQDIIVVGPPMGGVSTLAENVSKKLYIPLRTFDTMLLDVSKTEGEMGKLARIICGLLTEQENADRQQKQQEFLDIAEKSKIDAVEAYKKEKKGKAKEIPDEVYRTAEVEAYEAYLKSWETSPEMVAQVLQYRQSWEDFSDGAVYDNLITPYVSMDVLVSAIAIAMPSAIFAAVSVEQGESGFVQWIDHLYQSQKRTAENVRRSMESNRKLLIKTLRPIKGITMDEQVRQIDAAYSSSLVPEALPSGEESWIDYITGEVLELESNDYKALDDKMKPVYLRQILYSQSLQLQKAEAASRRIQKYKLTMMNTTQGEAAAVDPVAEENASEVTGNESPAPGAGVDAADSMSEPKEAPRDEEEVDQTMRSYQWYVETVLPVLSTIRKGVLSKPTEENPAPVVEESGEVAAQNISEVTSPVPPAEGEVPNADGLSDPAEPETAVPVVEEGGLYEIALSGDESVESVLQFALAQLPAPKISSLEKENVLPDDELYQVYRRPHHRPHRKPIKNFRIVDMADELIKPKPIEVASVVEPPPDPKAKGKAPPKGKQPVVEAPPVAEVVEVKPTPPPPTRWIVPAHGSVELKVRFACEKEGSYETAMEFEVVGTGQKFHLLCRCICEYPKINIDTRNLFMRRLKAFNPNNPYPIKRFVIADNTYSFGSLALFKKPDWKKEITESSSEEDKEKQTSIESTHSDIVRITNNGKYKCLVTLDIEYEENEPRDIFSFEPASLEVDEGETKEIRAWAMPKEVRDYRATMSITVDKNPSVTKFGLKCAGADATVDLLGPWTDALQKAEDALAKNTDKKAAKQLEANLASLKEALLIDFDRVLLKKNEIRSFTVKNTCTIPVAWEIVPEDFADHPNISFHPAAGVVPYNESVEVQVHFTSPEALMLTGKFSLKYADNEGGLQTARAIVKKFKVQAEAYSINAVTLSSAGSEVTGSSEVDFGLVRVGDYAVQTLKIGNKGKYKIGYSFHPQTPAIAELIKLDPMEGTIDPGTTLAEVKVTFCAKDGEINLKGNGDVMVHITEPLTCEIVEKFPLLVSAHAKYNRFRLQPSKGISFGAIRFDADPRVKRAELRNESAFEVTYVIMPASAETEEIDVLDNSAFAGYAYGVPAAIRAKELGEQYLKRAGGGVPDKGAKKDAKPPAKGKGAPVVEAPTSTLNPLVKDPDNLQTPTLPSDPLVVGAFTIHPRIATVQPGQAVSIDMKFDPSGCVTVKEKLRICVSGADPNDPLTQVVRTFEVVGESCLPALVTDDMISIFEEQEVVSSLADSMGDKDKLPGETGKLEKLPVGKVVFAEAERMLAYGPVLCNQSGKGAMERIKITNPTKIDIKVKFKVLSPEAFSAHQATSNAANSAAAAAAKDAKGKGAKDAGKDAGKGKKGAETAVVEAPSVFAVHPEIWEIPPHEYRFVNVYFNPTEIKSYRSFFLAEIDDEGVTSTAVPKGSNAGRSLSFGLGGSGTLPCIAIEQPTDRDAQGNIVIPFGKVLLEKSLRRHITVRNDGVMPATCLFDCTGSNKQDFVFPAHGTSLQLLPGGKQELQVMFSPKSVEGNGDCSATVKISVLNNPFGVFYAKLSGTSYTCDAVLDVKPAESMAGEDDDDHGNRDELDKLDGLSSEQKNRGAEKGTPEIVQFPDINLSGGQTSSQTTIVLRSRANHYQKFDLSIVDPTNASTAALQAITLSPSMGHLAPFGTRDITVTMTTDKPLTVENIQIQCTLKKIDYKYTSEDPIIRLTEENLWGKWDNAMKSIRPAYPEDIKAIQDYAAALKDYQAKVEVEKAKGKKAKPVGPPPEKVNLELAPAAEDGQEMVYEIVTEPFHDVAADYQPQSLSMACGGVADEASIECESNGDTLKFLPTYLFQSTTHKFTFRNKSKIATPIVWYFENMYKKRTSRPHSSTASRAATAATAASSGNYMQNVPNPFSLQPVEMVIPANGTQEFILKFAPVDAGEYLYALRGFMFPDSLTKSNRPSTAMASNTAPFPTDKASVNMMVYGLGKRPVCHFEIKETPDYLSRRLPNLKNENGVFSSIETTDLKIIEVESVGVKTRNTYRFYVTNTTNESYEFLWETTGEASPFWRCVQSAGMMFPGKRIEMIFEYLPEDTQVAESFFMFKLPKVGLSQLFLFAGKVNEPKISFSSAKLDFHAVMLGGEGITETVYLENHEHMPFNFAFDKYSLMQLEGPEGPVLTVTPSEGSIPPNGKLPITFYFIPQEEVIYNYNVICNVKRKPNKLAINVKGEGYAVHPQIQLENTIVQPSAAAPTAAAAAATSTAHDHTHGHGKAAAAAAVAVTAPVVVQEKFLTLKPLPATNVADFGTVQVLDTLAKTITVLNAGKYNFDYSWNIDHIGNMLHLSGGKMNGTLLKGEELSYKLTFAPQSEGNLDKCQLRFTVAGKYVYQIVPRGLAVKPALRFSFMHHDFGACFITSPGGVPVVEEQMLVLKNHDPASNISVECIFQKIRALSVECPPSVIPPGGELAIPIRFAPREAKDYSFAVPFMVNGSSRVQVSILGQGIPARLELVNGSQRRTAFGLVNVGTSAQRTVLIVNKSKRALPLKLLEAGSDACNLSDRCIKVSPLEIKLAPRETYPITLDFSPTKRVSNFQEDLLVQYAGVTRTLVTISGKAQGIECALDTDSIPFGLVILDSQKVKKATLENSGDLTITYQWQSNTFGPHFRITPMAGKILPGNEQVFEITFKPQFVDEDIRQDNMTLMVPGREPMSITCSGVCISPPTENIKTLTFQSNARRNDIKTVKIANSSDRDWFISPSLQGVDWKVPYEFKVPAKGSADMPVTYYPLTMTTGDKKHGGRLFIALPDGSAELYDLVGTAAAPESSGRIDVETPAKKAATVTLKVVNWLSELQKLDVTMEILSKPSPATFVIAANATEVGPNGTKEFPVRFISYCEGNSQARITFTNPITGEYCFYDIFAKTTMAEVLETFSLEAPVRQTARAVITIENPLSLDHVISMGSIGKPHDIWWSCDNTRAIKVNELIPIAGNREGSFEIEYRPLTITDRPQEHLLSITTQELGVFKYKLVVRASPPLLKQVLRFDAALGTMQTEHFVFRSYHSSAPNPPSYNFACAVASNPDCFSVPKTFAIEPANLAAVGSVAAWEGEEMRLPIQFEPVSIGDFRDVVTLKGTDGAEYVCELIGHCTPPLPQGPVTIDNAGPATGTEIIFRNCFTQSCQWSFATDSPLFRIVTPASNAPLSVNAKSEAKCSVVFEPREEADLNAPGGIIAGKLFVSCVTKPEIPAWVYYLRGRISVKTAAPAAGAGKKK
jgi:hypothetical protein